MSDWHKAYIDETGGRKITYAAWLEWKLGEFAVAYESMLDLVKACHHALLTGTEDERRALVTEMEAGFKDIGLFDEAGEVKQ